MNQYNTGNENQSTERRRRRWSDCGGEHLSESPNSKVWKGMFLLIIGGVLLAKAMGMIIPHWVTSWQMILIVIGLFIGARRNFRGGGWYVPIIIGIIFLITQYSFFIESRKFLVPGAFILFGLIFLINSRKKKSPALFEKKNTGMNTETITPIEEYSYSQDDIIDSTSIFGSEKRIVLSKNFRGGDITNIFGGCEIDFMQADMTAPATVDITALFGGATLIVPSHWVVKSEAVSIFGGISDKRRMTNYTDANTKVLVLKGTVIFGGIDIKSY